MVISHRKIRSSACARQIEATAALKAKFPRLVLAGSAYTYFQEYLPHVAQWVVREGWTDTGRPGSHGAQLSHLATRHTARRANAEEAHLPYFLRLHHRTPQRDDLRLYPLDPYYKGLPEAEQLKQIKKA